MVLEKLSVLLKIPDLNVLGFNLIGNYFGIICVSYLELDFWPDIDKSIVLACLNFFEKVFYSYCVFWRNLNQIVATTLGLAEIKVIERFDTCNLLLLRALWATNHAFHISVPQLHVPEFHLQSIKEDHTPP